jgi:hypothetical protein
VTELNVQWHDPEQAGVSFSRVVRPWCHDMWKQGKQIAAQFCELEDAKTERQRKFYHGVVLKTIAEQAVVNGQRFPLPVWKEHFREEHLGYVVKSFTNPLTGKKHRRKVRLSTEDLGVRKYAELIEKVMAFAATELGVEFPPGSWEFGQ